MRAVLVTGGAGYIGSHACKALSNAGYLPVAFDNLSRGHRALVRWGPLEVGDLLDVHRLKALDAHYDFVGAMHFAAYIAVGESVADPAIYYRNNVGGTLSLLDYLRPSAVPIIFSSTAAVYGIPRVVPIPETASLDPINPYGRTKLAGERMIADYASAYGLKYAVLRYFNAAGADPQGEAGECHEPETHLIPLALEAASGQRQLTVFGTDYPTTDGTCIRDYIHVIDLVEAHVAALDRLIGGGSSVTLNLGTGQGVSIGQVLTSVERITGSKVPRSVGERRTGDPAELVADPSLACAVLAWSPRRSDIDSIVDSAWRWHQRNQHLAEPRRDADKG